MKLRRFLALLLGTLLALGMFGAVANADEPLLSTDLDTPVKFSYLRPVWGPPTYEKGNEYEQELFRLANVQIEASIVPVFDYEAKFATMMAGGTQFDVVWHAGPGWSVGYDFINQGAFIPLDDLLAKYPAVKAAVPDATWDLTRSEDGHNYFFPAPLANFVPFPIYYRADILKELGIEPPTTIDGLVDALKKIKEQKPEMIPFSLHEYSQWYFQCVANAFGYNFGWIPDPANAERIIPANTTSNYKEFLRWVQMLRKEGLIDPDYLVAPNLKGYDKFIAGDVAFIATHWGTFLDFATQTPKNVPTADVAALGMLTGPNGVMGARALSGYDRGFSITIGAKDKADDIFKYLNWAYTVGYEFMRYGKEDKNFTRDAEGNIVSIPDADTDAQWKAPNREPFGLPSKAADTIPGSQSWLEMYNNYKKLGVEGKLDMVRATFEEAAKLNVPDYRRLVISPTENEIGTTIGELLDPVFTQILIDPTADVDALFDKAVADWMAAGGSQIIDEINAAQADKSKPIYVYEYTGPDYR